MVGEKERARVGREARERSRERGIRVWCAWVKGGKKSELK